MSWMHFWAYHTTTT